MPPAFLTAEAEDLALVAAIEPGNLAGQLAGEEQETAEGHVLAERHEMNLVVAADGAPPSALTTRASCILAIRLESGDISMPIVPTTSGASLARAISATAFLKAGIVLKEWRGRLAAMRSDRDAWDTAGKRFAGWSAGLGMPACKSCTAAGGQLGKAGDMAIPFTGAHP